MHIIPSKHNIATPITNMTENTIFANNGKALKLIVDGNDIHNKIELEKQQKHEHEMGRKKCVEYIGALSKAISTAHPYKYIGDMNDEQKREYYKTNNSNVSAICVSGCVPVTIETCPKLKDIAMLLHSNNITVNGGSSYNEAHLINGINSHNGCKTDIYYDSKNKNLCIRPSPDTGYYY